MSSCPGRPSLALQGVLLLPRCRRRRPLSPKPINQVHSRRARSWPRPAPPPPPSLAPAYPPRCRAAACLAIHRPMTTAHPSLSPTSREHCHRLASALSTARKHPLSPPALVSLLSLSTTPSWPYSPDSQPHSVPSRVSPPSGHNFLEVVPELATASTAPGLHASFQCHQSRLPVSGCRTGDSGASEPSYTHLHRPVSVILSMCPSWPRPP